MKIKTSLAQITDDQLTREQALWQITRELRDDGGIVTDYIVLKSCVDRGMSISLDDVEHLSRRFSRRGNGMDAIPVHLASFISELVSATNPSSVLLPYTTGGILPVCIANRVNPETIDAFSPRSETADVLRWLGDKSTNLQIGKPLTLIDDLNKFGAIAACVPFGVRAPNHEIELGEQVFRFRDLGEQLIIKSCQHLERDGVGVFVVSSSLFMDSDRAGGFHDALEYAGWHIDAAIELPRSALHSTHRPTHVIVIRENHRDMIPGEMIFTGRLPDDEEGTQQLLANYQKRKTSSAHQLGYLAPKQDFRGFSPIEHALSAARLAKHAGLEAVPFECVFVGVSSIRRDTNLTPSFLDESNDFIFLPRFGSRPVIRMQDELPERMNNYFQLEVNTDVADADYLVQWFNSPHGIVWRDSLKSGGGIAGISRRNLQASALYLPPKNIQAQVVDCHNQIENEQARLNELSAGLWKKPKNVEAIDQQISSAESEKSIEHWIDSLPFPLASILWICHAESGSPEDQFRRKLHFFEAFSEFLAVLHMSAFSSDISLWKETSADIDLKLKEAHLSLERATFGTWNVINQRLMKRLRTMLNDEESKELCLELYRTNDRRLLSALCGKPLLLVLQKANTLRNRMAHGGAISETEANDTNDALQQLILDVRREFGFLWEDYQLLLPGPNEYDAGVFKTEVQVLQGTRQPFPWSSVDVLGPMQKGSLHFKSIDGQQTLELLPLVKVMEPRAKEQNACYFYNRKASDGISFLSYHSRAAENITERFQDTEKALSRLFLEE